MRHVDFADFISCNLKPFSHTSRYLLIPSGVHASTRLTSSDVVYDPLPLHHTAGGVLGAGQALVFGCTVVLRKKFSASNYWSDAAKYKCTVKDLWLPYIYTSDTYAKTF